MCLSNAVFDPFILLHKLHRYFWKSLARSSAGGPSEGNAWFKALVIGSSGKFGHNESLLSLQSKETSSPILLQQAMYSPFAVSCLMFPEKENYLNNNYSLNMFVIQEQQPIQLLQLIQETFLHYFNAGVKCFLAKLVVRPLHFLVFNRYYKIRSKIH